jgi:protein-disulfide isomerase
MGLALSIALGQAGMDAARLVGLWPCDVACQGGAHYQTVGDVSVIWLALGAHVLLATLFLRDIRCGGWCPWTIRSTWFLAGIAIFFLLIASALDLACPYCLATHIAALLLLFIVVPFPGAVRWWQAVSWLAAGWLVTNAVFHHQPVADMAVVGGTTPLVPTTDAFADADRGRTYGAVGARRTLEVVVDLTCRHCAEQYLPLMRALQPAIAAGQVRVVVRHLVRPSQPASRPAARLVIAAATMGEHAPAMEVLLGSNPDAGAAGLIAKLGELLDPARLEATLARDAAAIDSVLDADQRRVGELGTGPRTPAAVLIEDGRVGKRWSGDLPIPELVAAVDGVQRGDAL